MKVIFSREAQKEYIAWEKSNPRMSDKIVELIKDIQKNGFLVGKGKPEQLKHYKNPFRFSRRITKSDRLVYSPTSDNNLLIISCKGHYED
ncbi:Txe/YoeB family addiction module toxin [Microgenomates group bacterium]|nr:Txe/YoeB family addiction module toxin [Microgenomates group bacterium]